MLCDADKIGAEIIGFMEMEIKLNLVCNLCAICKYHKKYLTLTYRY